MLPNQVSGDVLCEGARYVAELVENTEGEFRPKDLVMSISHHARRKKFDSKAANYSLLEWGAANESLLLAERLGFVRYECYRRTYIAYKGHNWPLE